MSQKEQVYDKVICPICDGTEVIKLDGQKKDDNDKGVVKCVSCGLGIELSLRLNNADYSKTFYDQTRGVGNGTWARFHHDSFVASERLKQLKTALPKDPGVWLDVGCSNGATISYLRRQGWTVAGVEADPAFCQEVTSMVGAPIMPYRDWLASSLSLKARPSDGFTVISFFDVLEHVIDPVAAIQAAVQSCSSNGGLIVVEAPDFGSCPDIYSWKHRRLHEGMTEHIWHFTKSSLEILFRRHVKGAKLINEFKPSESRIQLAFEIE